MKVLFRRLIRFFFPVAANEYRPGIFSKKSVLAIAALLVFGQVVWFGMTVFVFKNPGFLGAILPGVLTALTNGDRAQNGVGALAENALLQKAAQAKADDMAAKGYFSHVTPDGKAPWYWLEQAGYRYTYAGENLAVDFTDSKDVETAWMNSPTHRANIVKPQFTEIGIAVANGTYQGRPATFVVQFFGTPVVTASKPVAATKPQPKAHAAEVATVMTENVAPTSTAVTSAPVETTVLGTSVAPAPSPTTSNLVSRALNTIRTALASPDHTMLYVLGGIIALLALLLALSVLVKLHIQYREVIGGGAVLLAIAVGSIFFLQARMDHVGLPADGQAASVYAAFSGN